jgi:hypothetical protein
MTTTPMPTYNALFKFYRAVAKLTLEHDVVDDFAVIHADKLGDELEKVDLFWFKEIVQ